jgi:hypothetical protein
MSKKEKIHHEDTKVTKKSFFFKDRLSLCSLRDLRAFVVDLLILEPRT